MLVEIGGQRLQCPGAVMEGELAQSRAADLPCMGKHVFNSPRPTTGKADLFAGDGAMDEAGTCGRV